MNKAVPWNISGVGFDAREAARTAARRQGKSLGAWLHGVIEDHASELGIAAKDVGETDRIEAVTAKLERLSRRADEEARPGRDATERREPSGRDGDDIDSRRRPTDQDDFDAPIRPPRRRRGAPAMEETEFLLEDAIDALERRSLRAQRRTEDAIASFAQMLETNETKRDLERAAVRELTQKLSEIETKLSVRDVSANTTPIVGALARLEARLDTIGRRSDAELAVRRQTQVSLDQTGDTGPWPRYGEAVEASADRAPLPRPPSANRRLGDAISEISRRQRILDEPNTLATDPSGASVWARRVPPKRDAEVTAPWQRSLSDMQAEIAALASKIEDMRRDVVRPRVAERMESREPSVDLNGLRTEIGMMSQALVDLAPRGTADRLTDSLDALTRRAETSRDHGVPFSDLPSVEAVIADLRQSLGAIDPRSMIGHLEAEMRAVAAKVDGLSGTNDTVLSRLLAQMESIHALLTKTADRPPEVERIERRAETLGAEAAHFVAGRTAGRASTPEETRTSALEKIESRLDALSQKLDHAIQPPSPDTRADVAALERLVLALGRKIEAAQTPGADHDAVEALQTEIAAVSSHLGQSAGDLGSLTNLQTSVGDLFAHLDETRAEIETSISEGPGSPGRTGLPDVAALKALQEAADTRTQSTLNAVHQTLEHIVGRMSAMESDLVKTRRPTPQTADRDAPSMPTTPAWTIAPEKPIDRIEAHREPLAAQRTPARGKGATVPGRQKAPTTEEDTGREDFIAAARRAAKVAQANPSVGAIRQPAVDTDARAGLLAKSRDYVATHKRPVLLSVAAVFVVLGTMAIVQRMTFDVDDSKIVAATPAKITRMVDAGVVPTTHIATAAATPGDLSPSALPVGARTPPAQIAGADPIQTGSFTTVPSFAALGAAAPAKPAIPSGLTAMAESGDGPAEYELASRYADGKAVPRDFKSAVQWYTKAAEQGIAPAEYRLAALYEKGLGVPQDKVKAKALYQRAADAGNPRAMHNLAVLLADGNGKPDYEGAATWFRKAAQYGIHDSQYNLAILLARGLGVEQSLVQSYQWFAVAAAHDDADAAKKRDEVGDKMSAADLAVAKTLAAAFQPRKPTFSAVDVATPAGGWDSVGTASHLNSAKSKISSL